MWKRKSYKKNLRLRPKINKKFRAIESIKKYIYKKLNEVGPVKAWYVINGISATKIFLIIGDR